MSSEESIRAPTNLELVGIVFGGLLLVLFVIDSVWTVRENKQVPGVAAAAPIANAKAAAPENKRPRMPSKAILGEWDADKATYFISDAPGKHIVLTKVFKNGAVDDSEYAITNENINEGILEFQTWMRKEKGETRAAQSELARDKRWLHFKMSADRNTVEIRTNSGSGDLQETATMPKTIKYVSDKTSP